ncbi:MAG: hypothetical protein Q8S08_05810 [Halomonas sp.]|nr:hypothetical protein [Halomonas sp.]MDP3534885.1 hypothetical protein [Halomonas sp.]
MPDFFANDGLSVFRVLLSFAALVTVVIGWVVVNKHNNNREFRKELRSAIDEVIKQVREITDYGVEYHANAKDKTLEAKIVLSLKSLNRRVDRLPFSYYEKESVKLFLRSHKKSITGVNSFGTGSLTSSSPDYYTIEVAGIINASDDLIDELERAFLYKCSFL